MTYRFALVAALLATGCAYRTPDVRVPGALASAPVSSSDVTVVDARTAIDDATVEAVRADTAALLAHTGGIVHAHVVLKDAKARRRALAAALDRALADASTGTSSPRAM